MTYSLSDFSPERREVVHRTPKRSLTSSKEIDIAIPSDSSGNEERPVVNNDVEELRRKFVRGSGYRPPILTCQTQT